MINKSWGEHLHLALGKRCKVGQHGTSIAWSAAHCVPNADLTNYSRESKGCGDKTGYPKELDGPYWNWQIGIWRLADFNPTPLDISNYNSNPLVPIILRSEMSIICGVIPWFISTKCRLYQPRNPLESLDLHERTSRPTSVRALVKLWRKCW